MLTKNTERRRNMSFSDKVAMHKLLSEQLNGKDREGYVSYRDGWDDDRVATLFSVGVVTVRRFRQQQFGEMKTGLVMGPLWQLVRSLEDRVTSLEKKISESAK